MENILITDVTPEQAKCLPREQLSEILHTMLAYTLSNDHDPQIDKAFDKADEEFHNLIDSCHVIHFYDEETFKIRLERLNKDKGKSFRVEDYKIIDDGTRYAIPSTYLNKYKYKRFRIYSRRYCMYNTAYSKELAPVMLFGLFYEANHKTDQSLIYLYNNYANIKQNKQRVLQGKLVAGLFLDHINKYGANPQNLDVDSFTQYMGKFFDSLMPKLSTIRVYIGELQDKLNEEGDSDG